jgi:DNA-binding FrmR family transcriptional regulator
MAETRRAEHAATGHATNDVVRRLKSVEGHVRGVQRMVEDGEYCIDVVNQIIGIQRALKKVSALLLDHHLHACVTDAMRGPDAAARERVLGELLEVFDASGRA